MSESAGARRVQQLAGIPLGSPVHGQGSEIDRLRREQGELWQWVHQLQRLSDAGLQARGLAHDLGNTLTSLMAGSELALQQDDLSELRRALGSNLELARVAAPRLHTFVRYTIQGATDEDVGVPLSEVVEDAITFLAHPVRKAQVEIDRDYASESGVAGSRPELMQVVGTALLSVVGGFGPAGGILEIRVEDLEHEDEVGLRIRRAALSGDSEGSEEGWAQGSGLEVTVARRIVASLGGRLTLKPGAPVAQLRLPTVAAGRAKRAWRETPGRFAGHHHPAGDRARRA